MRLIILLFNRSEIIKKECKSGPLPWRFSKIDLKMKLTTFFLVVSLFQV